MQAVTPHPGFGAFIGVGFIMDKPAQNIQDSFLNNARKEKGLVTIYLLSGVKLSGRIKSFDKYSLVLETNNQEQLIFKHAISTVVTTCPASHVPPVQALAPNAASVPPAPAAPVGPGGHSVPGQPLPPAGSGGAS